MTPVYLVAIEYAGADIARGSIGRRRPVLEHAFEAQSGRLPAHPRYCPRVAFPEPERGWPSLPLLARCPTCTAVISALVADLVASMISGIAMDFRDWAAPAEDPPVVWLISRAKE